MHRRRALPIQLLIAVLLTSPMASSLAAKPPRPTTACVQAAPYRVTVLTDDIPTLDVGLVRQLSGAMTAAGITVTPITAEQMSDAKAFSAQKFNCLVLSDSPHFPAIAEAALLKFIRGGGDLVLMGGEAFQEPLWKQGGRWLTRAAVQALPQGTPRPAGFSSEKEIAFYGAFEDYEVRRLEDVTAIKPWSRQSLFPRRAAWSGRFEGVSAIGFAIPREARFVPLLGALDRHKRVRGWAGGVLVNFAGPYPHSKWALFGITTPAFYQSAEFSRVLIDVLRRFQGDELESWAAAEYAKDAAKVVEPPSNPPPAVRINRSARLFERADGQPLFLIGCNYTGGLHIKFSSEDAAEVEGDFQRMQRAGINAVRIYGMSRFLTERGAALLKNCARKYGVYFMPVAIDHPDQGDKAELEAQARQMAQIFRGEPMLLGYDLMNEPYFWKLGPIRAEGGQTLARLNPMPKNSWKIYGAKAGMQLAGPGFPELSGKLPYPPEGEARQAFDSVNNIYGTVIGWLRSAIREVDSDVPITVGYNTVWGLMPANEPLEFVAAHFYRRPEDLESVRRNTTSLDTFRAVWPDRPVCAGEFGYSGGDVVRGRLLDVHTIAVGELAHYLYALSHRYAGMFKWSLADASRWEDWRQVKWIPWEQRADHLRQARFGLYYDDGTPEGKGKPLVPALRFLRDYVDSGNRWGEFQVAPADTLLGAGYVYRSPNALFVGNVRYDSHKLRMESRVPANVMLWWDEHELRILATADAVIGLRPSDFVLGLPADTTRLRGTHGAVSIEDGRLVIEVLEGERATVR